MDHARYTQLSDDAQDQASNLRGWSQLYDQLSSGGFHGVLHGLQLNTMHVFLESTSLSLRQSCFVRSNSWWFGIPVGNDSFRVNGRNIHPGSIAVRPGHTRFELITPAAFQIFGIVVSSLDLERHLHTTDPEATMPLSPTVESLMLAPAGMSALQRLMAQVLQQTQLAPSMLACQAAHQSIRLSLLDAIVETLAAGKKEPRTRLGEINQAALVRNVRQHFLAHTDRAVTVPELCTAFGVSRRTLQYAFQNVVGIKPNAYLRALRLNGVRRTLRLGRDSDLSVQQAAGEWGFWHLSQFARDYRLLFGELPSQTLLHRPPPLRQV